MIESRPSQVKAVQCSGRMVGKPEVGRLLPGSSSSGHVAKCSIQIGPKVLHGLDTHAQPQQRRGQVLLPRNAGPPFDSGLDRRPGWWPIGNRARAKSLRSPSIAYNEAPFIEPVLFRQIDTSCIELRSGYPVPESTRAVCVLCAKSDFAI